MPKVRMVEMSEVRQRPRGRNNEQAQKDREEARQLLIQARKSGKVIELTLGPEERDETIKGRFRAAAKIEQLKLRFQTAKQRTYRNRRGMEETEAEVLLVLVSTPA